MASPTRPAALIQPECDIRRSQFGAQLGTFDQRPDARTQLLAKCFNAELDHYPVFAEQRNDIRDGSQRHIVEHLFQTGLETAQIVLPPVFDESVGQLESRTGSGEQLEVLQFRIDLGIDHRERLGQFAAGLVVVGHDHVDPALHGVVDGVAAGDAAIDGDEHLARPEGVKRLLQRLRSKTVPVIEPVRNEGVDDPAVLPQHEREQCAGGDAVGVVVAVNQDRLFVRDGIPKPSGGLLNSGKPVRIRQICEAGIQKILDIVFADPASGKVKRDRMGQRKLLLNPVGLFIQIIPGKFPIFYTHVTLSI